MEEIWVDGERGDKSKGEVNREERRKGEHRKEREPRLLRGSW